MRSQNNVYSENNGNGSCDMTYSTSAHPFTYYCHNSVAIECICNEFDKQAKFLLLSTSDVIVIVTTGFKTAVF